MQQPVDGPPDKTHLIETRGLVKAYGYNPVLRKLDFRVQRGEFVALLGPNGSGKSTLLRLLSGLSKPTAGEIIVGGWTLPQEASAVRSQIGMVGHKSLLYEALTARDNLRFFAKMYNVQDVEDRIQTLVSRVGLAKRADEPVRAYSRGMQQRLSIARALLHEPAVLLFDEPYTGLDQDAGAVLDALLLEARDEGRTIIMSSHQLVRAARLAGRMVILSRGQIGYDAPAAGMSDASIGEIFTEVTGMATAR